MGEVIAVISGKGGTGKTSVCAAVASCLAAEGKRVLCIDADIGLRNLDIALGMAELPVLAFTEILEGNYALADATAHPELPNLFLLTAPSRALGQKIDEKAFACLLQEAREQFDFCLIDSAAGIGDGFRLATEAADRCMIVCTPDPASLRDAACAADLLELRGRRDVRLVVNRVSPRMFSALIFAAEDGAAEACLRISRRLRGDYVPLMKL